MKVFSPFRSGQCFPPGGLEFGSGVAAAPQTTALDFGWMNWISAASPSESLLSSHIRIATVSRSRRRPGESTGGQVCAFFLPFSSSHRCQWTSGRVRVVIFLIGPTRLHTQRVNAVRTVVDVPTCSHAYLRIIIPVPTIPPLGHPITSRQILHRPTEVCVGVCVAVCVRINPSLSVIREHLVYRYSFLFRIVDQCIDSDWSSLKMML